MTQVFATVVKVGKHAASYPIVTQVLATVVKVGHAPLSNRDIKLTTGRACMQLYNFVYIVTLVLATVRRRAALSYHDTSFSDCC